MGKKINVLSHWNMKNDIPKVFTGDIIFQENDYVIVDLHDTSFLYAKKINDVYYAFSQLAGINKQHLQNVSNYFENGILFSGNDKDMFLFNNAIENGIKWNTITRKETN